VRALADEIEARFLGDKKTIANDEIAKCGMDVVRWDPLLPGAILCGDSHPHKFGRLCDLIEW